MADIELETIVVVALLDSFVWYEEQAQAQRDGVVAAQKALGKNHSTFAVLPVHDLLRQRLQRQSPWQTS
jgi:hypothetical protein